MGPHRDLRDDLLRRILDESVARGLEDVKAGRVRPADEVFDELRRELAKPRPEPARWQKIARSTSSPPYPRPRCCSRPLSRLPPRRRCFVSLSSSPSPPPILIRPSPLLARTRSLCPLRRPAPHLARSPGKSSSCTV